MTTTVTLRPMRWWDIEALLPLEQESFGPTAWSPAQFWGELAQPTRAYVVAEDDGEIVGYAGIHALAPDADIQTIVVAESARGQGLGRALLDWLMAAARDRDCARMFLEVRADNMAAQALYRAAGFLDIATRRGYYGPGEDAVVMRVSLRGRL